MVPHFTSCVHSARLLCCWSYTVFADSFLRGDVGVDMKKDLEDFVTSMAHDPFHNCQRLPKGRPECQFPCNMRHNPPCFIPDRFTCLSSHRDHQELRGKNYRFPEQIDSRPVAATSSLSVISTTLLSMVPSRPRTKFLSFLMIYRTVPRTTRDVLR